MRDPAKAATMDDSCCPCILGRRHLHRGSVDELTTIARGIVIHAVRLYGSVLGELPWPLSRLVQVAGPVFLVVNPVLLAIGGPLVASWAILLEFIGTLMMALRCYPLQPGGLLAIQAVVLGLVTPAGIQQEIETDLPVILLLIFMVAAIYFLREMLVYTFTKLLVRVQSRSLLAFLFVAMGALLSAFLDALTVLAVIITVAGGFYAVYHRVASGKPHQEAVHDATCGRRDS